MPNGLPNPLAAPLSTIKQIGEMANINIQGLGTGLARAASQGLDALSAGVPPLPGIPGAQVGAGIPGLLPANLTQILSQVETVFIPPGLPRPSQVMAGAPGAPAPAPAPPAPVSTPTAVSGRRRITELGGF